MYEQIAELEKYVEYRAIKNLSGRLIEQRYLGIARYEKATAVKEKGRNISCGAASNVSVLLEK